MRQLLIEGLVLALAGGAAGNTLASWIVGVVKQVAPAAIPRLDDVGIDPMVVGFAAAVACGATVLFALAPALRIVRADPARSMKEGSRGTDGPGRATPDVPSSRRRWRCPSRCSSPPRLATSLARLQAIDVGFATDVLLHRLRFRPTRVIRSTGWRPSTPRWQSGWPSFQAWKRQHSPRRLRSPAPTTRPCTGRTAAGVSG